MRIAMIRNSQRHYFWYHHWQVGSENTNCPFGVDIVDPEPLDYVCNIDISYLDNGADDMLTTGGESWDEINELVMKSKTYVRVFMPKMKAKVYLY